MYARWRDESILSLPKERCHALYGAELAQVWERVRSNGGLETDKKGRPAALRWFREESVKDQVLEISAPPPKQSRSGVADWFADRLRGRSVERQA
jgi:hypothetical protein